MALRLCRCRVDAVGQLTEGVRLKSAIKQHQRQAAHGDQAFHVEAAVEHSASNHAAKETLPPRESVKVAYKLRFLTLTGQAEPKLPSLVGSDAIWSIARRGWENLNSEYRTPLAPLRLRGSLQCQPPACERKTFSAG